MHIFVLKLAFDRETKFVIAFAIVTLSFGIIVTWLIFTQVIHIIDDPSIEAPIDKLYRDCELVTMHNHVSVEDCVSYVVSTHLENDDIMIT